MIAGSRSKREHSREIMSTITSKIKNQKSNIINQKENIVARILMALVDSTTSHRKYPMNDE